MKYRSRTEIVAQMLELANDGITKTRIMYGAFLSYPQLKEYLAMLVENNLLDYDNETQHYKTTAKGMQFLRLYNDVDALIIVPPKTAVKPKRPRN